MSAHPMPETPTPVEAFLVRLQAHLPSIDPAHLRLAVFDAAQHASWPQEPARPVLRLVVPDQFQNIAMAEALQATREFCGLYGLGQVSLVDLMSGSREARIVRVRHLAMWALRHATRPQATLPEIGAFLERDHSTVRHGITRAIEREDPSVLAALRTYIEANDQ